MEWKNTKKPKEREKCKDIKKKKRSSLVEGAHKEYDRKKARQKLINKIGFQFHQDTEAHFCQVLLLTSKNL